MNLLWPLAHALVLCDWVVLVLLTEHEKRQRPKMVTVHPFKFLVASERSDIVILACLRSSVKPPD